MNRLIRWSLGVLLVVLAACCASAQTFPLAVKAYWLPNAASESVTGYTVSVDGGAPIPVGTAVTNDTNCPVAQYPGGCILAPLTIQASGQHTFAIVAVNVWGSSPPFTVTVNISNPGQIVWVKVTK